MYLIGRHILGVLLAQQRGNLRQDLTWWGWIIFQLLITDGMIISRDHHCPHHDLPGTGGKEGPAEGALPHRPGLLCLHLLHLHLLYCCSGQSVSQSEGGRGETELKLYRLAIPRNHLI